MTAVRPASAPIRTAVVGFGVSGKVFHAPLIAADPAYCRAQQHPGNSMTGCSRMKALTHRRNHD